MGWIKWLLIKTSNIVEMNETDKVKNIIEFILLPRNPYRFQLIFSSSSLSFFLLWYDGHGINYEDLTKDTKLSPELLQVTDIQNIS